MSACRGFSSPIFRSAMRQEGRTIAPARIRRSHLALNLLEQAFAPRTTVQNPLRWSDDPSWKLDYANIERLSAEEIARRRADFDRQKADRQDRCASLITLSRGEMVSWRPPLILHLARRGAGGIDAEHAPDEMQAHADAGGNSRRSHDRTRIDEGCLSTMSRCG